MLTENQTLDKLFQQVCLKKTSVLGGVATVVHHFIPKSHCLAVRYYIPNGIPLTYEQHLQIHSNKRKELEEQIIQILGISWRADLRKRQNMIIKDIDYEKVKNYLNGKISDYL